MKTWAQHTQWVPWGAAGAGLGAGLLHPLLWAQWWESGPGVGSPVFPVLGFFPILGDQLHGHSPGILTPQDSHYQHLRVTAPSDLIWNGESFGWYCLILPWSIKNFIWKLLLPLRQVWGKFNLERKPQRKTHLWATSREASFHSYSPVQSSSIRGRLPAELRSPTSGYLAGEQAIRHPTSHLQTGPDTTVAPVDIQTVSYSRLRSQMHEQQEQQKTVTTEYRYGVL